VVAPLDPEKTIELGHHILKAHIYKNIGKQRGYSSRDMQAFWVALSSENLSTSLVCQRNLYSPNVKVHISHLPRLVDLHLYFSTLYFGLRLVK